MNAAAINNVTLCRLKIEIAQRDTSFPQLFIDLGLKLLLDDQYAAERNWLYYKCVSLFQTSAAAFAYVFPLRPSETLSLVAFQ